MFGKETWVSLNLLIFGTVRFLGHQSMSNIFTLKISVEHGIIPSISFKVDKSDTISVNSIGSNKTRGKVLSKIQNLNG